jgi:predicted membrane channel-forming protein YqfA (hemolysin III family)
MREGITMPPTDAEKAKARKAQIILYLLMGLFILAPLVLLWIHR